jgi:peptidoglycan/LPS O-acetylase OafA/YrhL
MMSGRTRPDPVVVSATPRAAETTSPRGRPFFGRVESLRGLGAMAVAGYHISGLTVHGAAFFPYVPWDGVGTLQYAVGRLGLVLLPAHAALMVFFVISGFVLRLSLEYGPQQASTAVGKFLLGRIFRIYPVVIFAVVLMAVLTGCQVAPYSQLGPPPTVPRVIANLLLFDVSLNSTLWALQVELLMAPVILGLYFLERRRGPQVLLGLALATTALAFSVHWAVWPPLSTNVFPFILGMIVPTLGRRLATGLSTRAATLAVAAAVIVLVLPGACFGLYLRWTAIVEAYAAVTLVSLVAYRPDVSLLRCLDARALRLIGLASGSYYVLHMITVPAALALAALLIPPAWSVHVPALVGWLVVGGWLGLLAVLAVGSYYVIEAPGIALGRRVIRACRLDARPVPRPGSQPVSRREAA